MNNQKKPHGYTAHEKRAEDWLDMHQEGAVWTTQHQHVKRVIVITLSEAGGRLYRTEMEFPAGEFQLFASVPMAVARHFVRNVIVWKDDKHDRPCRFTDPLSEAVDDLLSTALTNGYREFLVQVALQDDGRVRAELWPNLYAIIPDEIELPY